MKDINERPRGVGVIAKLIVICLMIGVTPQAWGDDLTGQVRRFLESLRTGAEGESPEAALVQAEAALNADAPLAALRLIAGVKAGRAQASYAAGHSLQEGDGRDEFDALCQELGQHSGELLDLIRARQAQGRRPAVIEGWIDIALARNKAYFDTAIGFAKLGVNQSSDDYLLASLGPLERAVIMLGFDYPSVPPAPRIHGLSSALDRVETSLLKRFTGTTADDRYPPTVVANANVDFARKLIDAGKPTAAAIIYLEAVTTLYQIEHENAAPPDSHQFIDRAAEWMKRIEQREDDQSIARYLLQQAEVDMTRKDDPDGGYADACATINSALPAYFELIEGGPAMAASDDETRDTAPVTTVTILRYPYT